MEDLDHLYGVNLNVQIIAVVATLAAFIVFLKRGRAGDILNSSEGPPIDIARTVTATQQPKKEVTSKKKRVKNSSHSWVQSMANNTLEANPSVWLQEDNQRGDKVRGRKGRFGLPRGSLDLSSTGEPTITTTSQLTKVYSPLKIYDDLGVDDIELYRRLLQYVLTKEELKTQGFPVECPDVPGKASFGSYFTSQELNGEGSRSCCRCGATFYIEDGQYSAENDNGCTYHWGKRVGAIDEPVYFSCCNQDYKSEGCTWNKIHVSSQFFNEHNFVKTRAKKNVVRDGSYGIYSLDCEMCFTSKGLEVTKVTIVGSNGLAVYDTFVVPENPIVDYNTRFSGITANDLKNVKTNLADVQAFIQRLFSCKTILIGHGLTNDLKALHLIHETIIDTSVIFPHRFGLPYKRSLKSLTSSFLHRIIQEGKNGHDSVEDSRACMELILWKLQSDQKLLQSRLSSNIPVSTTSSGGSSSGSSPSSSPVLSPQSRLSPKPFYDKPWHMEPPPLMVYPQNYKYLRPTLSLSYSYGYWVPPVGSQMELY